MGTIDQEKIEKMRRRIALFKSQGPIGVVMAEMLDLFGDVKKALTLKKGDPGDPGMTPVYGEDYFTLEEQRAFAQAIFERIRVPKDGKTPLAGVDYPTSLELQELCKLLVSRIQIPEPVPGKTPVAGVDYFTDAEKWQMVNRVEEMLAARYTPEKIVEAINNSSIKIDASHISNLPRIIETRDLPTLSLFGGRGGGGGGARIRFRFGNEVYEDIQTIEFLSGFTVVRSAPGYLGLTATGGGGGSANIDTRQVTASQSGDNALIDLAQLPHTVLSVQFVTLEGAIILPNGNAGIPVPSWSQTGDIITVFNAAASNTFLVQYLYE